MVTIEYKIGKTGAWSVGQEQAPEQVATKQALNRARRIVRDAVRYSYDVPVETRIYTRVFGR